MERSVLPLPHLAGTTTRYVTATCAATCGQPVRFTAGSEGMDLERRAAIAEHGCPITTSARSSNRVASPRQPVDGDCHQQGHKVKLHDLA